MNGYLDRLKELVDKFSKINSKWKSIVFTDGGKKEDFEDLENELENCYLSAVQFALKNSYDMDAFDKEASKILGDQVFISLSGKMKMLIATFEDANLINSINDKAGFINECFDKAIVRRENSFFDDWERYGFASPEEMGRAVGAISRIAMAHVKVSFAKKTASSEFKRITDLEDELCSIYSEKYENSYEKIQMKIILRSYSNINEKVSALLDALTEK